MDNYSSRSNESAEAAVTLYGDMLFRLCFVMLGGGADAEDAVQDTMLAYLRSAPPFENAGHEKAWLITTAKNKCRDILRRRRRQADAGRLEETAAELTDGDGGILEALMSLPEKFRLVLILHYVEEYRVEEIARMVGKTPSAIKMRLKKGRELLREKYRKEYM